ncbi:MAG: type II toxin-antitoxin system RelE/ParE family toxin [Methylotenera sp.]|jgi:plasmid stabilization system protein ParE|nr:type II toxin-antitoxin system RelE/ParE family toxin [Methylotenera sp.]
MTQLVLMPAALADLERIRDLLPTHDPDNVEERLLDLTAALDVLTPAPEIGRRVGQRSRELLIGRGARGYVARYEYVARLEAAFILRVHHQREER